LNLKILAPVIGIALVVLAISFQVISTEITVTTDPTGDSYESSGLTMMETNGVKHNIPLDKIRSGGPP